jgi:hypothetical protein
MDMRIYGTNAACYITFDAGANRAILTNYVLQSNYQIDIDINDNVYGLDLRQNGTGGGVKIMNYGTGYALAVYDSGTLKFYVDQYGIPRVNTSFIVASGELNVTHSSAGDPAATITQSAAGPGLRVNRNSSGAGNIFEFEKQGTDILYLQGNTCNMYLTTGSFIVQSGQVAVTHASTGDPATIITQNQAGPGLRVNRVATGDAHPILQLQTNGTDKFTVENDGEVVCGGYIRLKDTDTDGGTQAQIWFDTSEKVVKFFNGTNVKTVQTD